MTSNGPHFGEAAQRALINAGTNRIGTYVPTPGPKGLTTTLELTAARVITVNGNLTRYGSIVRERLVSAQLEAAFG